MNTAIQPPYHSITAECSCGNRMSIHSTLKEDIHVDICSACHPFFTGRQKLIDTGGRVERFNKMFSKVKPKA